MVKAIQQSPTFVQWGLPKAQNTLRSLYGPSGNWPRGAVERIETRLAKARDLTAAQAALEEWIQRQAKVQDRINPGQVYRALKGPLRGRLQFAALSAPNWFFIRGAVIDQVRALLASEYEEWELDRTVVGCYEEFLKRLDGLATDECPFRLAFQFEALVRQRSFLDYKQRHPGTLRSSRRRSGKIDRGDIQGHRPMASDAEEADAEPVRPYGQTANRGTPVEARRVFLPPVLDEEGLDQLCTARNLDPIISSWDGYCSLELYARHGNGSTKAVYIVDGDAYKRVWPEQGRSEA